MAQGRTPGDGKTNPFGNGAGRPAGGKTMPNDFTRNPRGSGSGGARPRDFLDAGEKKSQRPRETDENPKDMAPGGKTAVDDVTPKEDAGNPIGTGTLGQAASKPFKLDGGG